ncbi:MAG: 5'/3'-nucleotidase SurE [Limnoraphis sp. WC205]|jgi:5'-nucleotidase|nr:5'/3'-nucleotidase SurE [Limnoraphis sp. WC205]
MKLLISNDDGIFAQGIRSLANHLAEVGHEVKVVCPDQERSATGHGLTLHQPIRAEKVESVFHPQVKAWACSGTPADCVKLALFGLLDTRPDFVLAGVNHGPNLGTDVLYSGTVSAAMEGMIEGIPSIALSLGSYSARQFQASVRFAERLLKQLEKCPLSQVMLLNVNIPAVPEEDILGVMVARQGIRRYIDIFEKRVDPRGKTYYWLAGEVLEEAEDPQKTLINDDLPTDVQALRQNYITMTPLQYNLTHTTGLKELQTWHNEQITD